MTTYRETIGSIAALTSSLLVMGACTSEPSEAEGAGGSGHQGGAATTGGGGSMGGGGPTGGGAAGGGPRAEVVAAFDPQQLELPEGLTVVEDTAYVGMALTATIEAISIDDGSRAQLGALPRPMADTGFLTGLTTDARGHVIAGLASFTPDPVPGAYILDDGKAQLLASHEALVFPNDFAWGTDGRLFVTDSASGAVLRLDEGVASVWLADPQLQGDAELCGGSPSGFAVGANGVVRVGDELWVASSDRGLVAKIPIMADGSAGTLELLAGPDCDLAGVDGIALDEDGSLLAAINRSDRIVRITPAGDVTTVFAGEPLDFPASVAVLGSGADRSLLVTSFAIGRFLSGGPAAPALVRIRLD